jgi:hypothetical protein
MKIWQIEFREVWMEGNPVPRNMMSKRISEYLAVRELYKKQPLNFLFEEWVRHSL